MDRSRSKRSYHYDPDSPPPPPRFNKPRNFDNYNNNKNNSNYKNQNYNTNRRNNPTNQPHRRSNPPTAASNPPPQPLSSTAPSFTTVFRILCPESKTHAFSPAAVASIRDETGAWVVAHSPFPGDSVRVIESSDAARRQPDGRPPLFSPAQDALMTIHQRILDAEPDPSAGPTGIGDDEMDEYGMLKGDRGRADRERGKITSRIVVPRLHVGCLLGKGGKIIEQMRNETNTHIRILPRDQHTPRCVSLSEEVVQVVGDESCVKRAIAIISDRLKESLHRDRSQFRGRVHSPERRIAPDDEYPSSAQHMSASEEPYGGPDHFRNNSRSMEPPGYAFDINGGKMIDQPQLLSFVDIVFRILCPCNMVDSLVGASSGIIDMLQADVGVDVKVSDPVDGSDERIMIITSKEVPDDELFPAQEALLHIQTHIVDLGPDKDNIITTRLLIPSNDITCLEGRDGSLADIQRLTSANVQILPKEDLPLCALESDELIQIVGDIRAARNALMLVTAKLRTYVYRDISGPNQVRNIAGQESSPPEKGSPREGYRGIDLPMAPYAQIQPGTVSWHSKETGGSASGSFEQEVSNINDDGRQSTTKRFAVPLVTRSTLEVVIPKSAAQTLTMRPGKLAQISEMSGATVTLIEDSPELTERIIQISGSPEQADKAKSLLQGFILSIQDDFPSG